MPGKRVVDDVREEVARKIVQFNARQDLVFEAEVALSLTPLSIFRRPRHEPDGQVDLGMRGERSK